MILYESIEKERESKATIQALIYAKEKDNGKVPVRVDARTIIMVNKDADKKKAVEEFLKRTNK